MADEQPTKKLTSDEVVKAGKWMHQNRESIGKMTRDEAREHIIEQTGVELAKGTFDRINKTIGIKYAVKRPGGVSKGLEALEEELGPQIADDDDFEEAEGQE